MVTLDIAKRHKCSVQAVNIARRKAEKKLGVSLGKPSEEDKRKTEFSEEDLKLISEFLPKRVGNANTVIDAEALEDRPEAITISTAAYAGIDGLSTVHQAPILITSNHDLQAQRAEANNISSHAVGQLSQLINRYAVSRAVGSFQRIDTLMDQLEAGAVNNAVAAITQEVVK